MQKYSDNSRSRAIGSAEVSAPAAESDTGLTDSATLAASNSGPAGDALTLRRLYASDSAEPGKHIECTIEHVPLLSQLGLQNNPFCSDKSMSLVH
jgi:hypothetical protein